MPLQKSVFTAGHLELSLGFKRVKSDPVEKCYGCILFFRHHVEEEDYRVRFQGLGSVVDHFERKIDGHATTFCECYQGRALIVRHGASAI